MFCVYFYLTKYFKQNISEQESLVIKKEIIEI